MKQDILEENIYLISELEKTAKHFTYFSQENTQELKTLLRLCGIPFVQAPFEAESQCAFLEINGLVDGVVTEDSDVLLFGARKVYRNIFDRNKFAEKYDMRIIERDMGLDRDDLIKMALFMGSDYTMGVRGIAAVNAIEIINSFQGDEGLEKFKQWVDIKQQIQDQAQKDSDEAGIVKKSQKQKLIEALENALTDEDKERPETEIEKEYKEKHKNWRRHWEFPQDFPSNEVIKAYKDPSIDDSKEKFTWGTPAFQELKSFAIMKLGWEGRDLDQYFNIVEKRMKEREGIDKKRGTLEQYFKKEEKFATIQSKRVVQAVKDLQHRKKRLKKNQ